MLNISPYKQIQHQTGFGAGPLQTIGTAALSTAIAGGVINNALPDNNYTPTAQQPQLVEVQPTKQQLPTQPTILQTTAQYTSPNTQYLQPQSVQPQTTIVAANTPIQAENKQQTSVRPTQQQLNLWREVAGGAEYGANDGIIKKWPANTVIPIYIEGINQNDVNHQFIQNNVIQQLNPLIAANGNRFEIRSVNPQVQCQASLPDFGILMQFTPSNNFPNCNRNANGAQLGFVWTWWNGGEINNAQVLIDSSPNIGQDARNHIIFEEITQSLGLLRDAGPPNSIFDQGMTLTQTLTPDDRAVVSIHSNPNILPGMSMDEAYIIASNSNSTIGSTPQQSYTIPQTNPNGSVPPIIIPRGQTSVPATIIPSGTGARSPQEQQIFDTARTNHNIDASICNGLQPHLQDDCFAGINARGY